MSSFKRSQAKYVKNRYRVRNWPEYEAGLRKRGSLTVWISEEELGSWEPSKTAKKCRGGQQKYSNRAIETAWCTKTRSPHDTADMLAWAMMTIADTESRSR